MEEVSLQQYFRHEMEEKQRKDEFDNLLEDTVHRIQRLKLRGKGRRAYLQSVYRENKKGICREIPERRFLMYVSMNSKR